MNLNAITDIVATLIDTDTDTREIQLYYDFNSHEFDDLTSQVEQAEWGKTLQTLLQK